MSIWLTAILATYAVLGVLLALPVAWRGLVESNAMPGLLIAVLSMPLIVVALRLIVGK